VLEEYKDGVWFVELAVLSPEDDRLVPSTIAETLYVREVPGQEVIDTLKDYLRDKQMLLVLDNFEQVTAAAPQVSSLLKAAPHLKVLVSSRIALRVYGERAYRVPPLSLPDRKLLQEHKKDSRSTAEQAEWQTDRQARLEQYTRCEAVRLFVERCQAVKADFEITPDNAPDIAKICARLDGLPLAIELAAARIRLFTPQALLGRLSDRLKILTGGAKDLPARQQTMRGAIEWSYELLSEEEKLLFRRLAVFSGGRTLEAVETVCSLDVLEGLQSLLDKSLLVEREGSDGEPRYWMLETIHEYASDKLRESGEEETLGREHALYFMRLAEEAAPGLTGNKQSEWLNRLEDEHDNLRAALRWARQPGEVEEGGEEQGKSAIYRVEVGLRIAAAILQFWITRGYFTEGREQLDGLLSLLPSLPALPILSPDAHDSLSATRYSWRAKALQASGILAHRQGDGAAAHARLEQALSMAREAGDKSSMARAFNGLGNVADDGSDYPAARSLYEQSLALYRELEDKRGISTELINLGNVATHQGDFPAARSLYAQSLALHRELGNKRSIAVSLINQGGIVYIQGDYSTAASMLQEGLALFRELEDKFGTAMTLNLLGDVADVQEDYPTARPSYEQSLALFQELGDKRGIALTLNALGRMAYAQGDYSTAASLYQQGLALFRETEHKRGVAVSLIGLGAIGIGAAKGREGSEGIEAAQRGARLLGASEALLESIGAVQEPIDRALYTKGAASARSQLGDEAFERARQEGRAMSEEAAIEFALQPTVYAPAHTVVGEVRAERQRQVEELRIEVNQAKKARQVEAIIGTEYFVDLQARASALLLERKEREASGHGRP
jgi:predicted ATPase